MTKSLRVTPCMPSYWKKQESLSETYSPAK